MTSTSSAPSWTSRRAKTLNSSSRATTTGGTRTTARRGTSSASPGAVDVISDEEFWGYKDYGANMLARLTPNRGFEYYAGYDFQNYSGEDEVLLIAPNTETVNALFGQVRTTRDLLGKATITAGVRYNAPSDSRSHTIWNVSGQYDFTASLFARGTVGTSFRYPDAYELFAIDPTCCFGNPDLKPESSTNLNGRSADASQRGRDGRPRSHWLLPQRRPTSSSTSTTAPIPATPSPPTATMPSASMGFPSWDRRR